MVMYLVNDGKSAHATLPTQQKSTLLPHMPSHAYADCIIAGQQPTQLYKEFPRIHDGHDAGHSKKKDVQLLATTTVEKCPPFWDKGKSVGFELMSSPNFFKQTWLRSPFGRRLWGCVPSFLHVGSKYKPL